MTDIKFHLQVADRMVYSARLARKSLAVGAKLCILAPEDEGKVLSHHLWSAKPTDFVPHALAGASLGNTLAASSVVIGSQVDDVDHHDVLLNLLPDVPTGFERFERLIELVGLSDDDKTAGRQRWRYYQARGYPLAIHEARS